MIFCLFEIKFKQKIDSQWKRALIDFNVENLFQIVFEIYKKSEKTINAQESDIVAVDNFSITYGSCNLLENIE